MKKLSRICFITPDGIEVDKLLLIIENALQAGIEWIQYRDKSDNKRLIYEKALQIKELTIKYRATLSINDYADIALAVDAEGVHLGQEDLPLREAKKIMGNKIIGISTHSKEEAIEAFQGDADYIGFGPIFYTKTKNAGDPKGLKELKNILDLVKIPVLAIGGINKHNLKSVIETGCYGVALSSGLLEGDMKNNIAYFLETIKFK